MAHFDSTSLATAAKTFNFAIDVVDHWAQTSPDRQALVWVSSDTKTSLSLTFTHFARQSHRLAILLRGSEDQSSGSGLGLTKGDRVIMIVPRLPVWWELATACLRTGIVMCPATTLLTKADIAYRCQRAGAKVFIGDTVSVGKFLQVRGNCPSVEHVINIDEQRGDGVAINNEGVISLSKALSNIPKDAVWKGNKPKPRDPALIYFTSGTTGPPKMVQHSQISYPLAHTTTGKHWLRLSPHGNSQQQQLYWNLSEQGWAKAAWSFFSAWNCGVPLFIHDDRSAFSPAALIRLLSKYPITTLCAPPTVYRQLVLASSQHLFKQHPPMALRHCTGAGEPLNAEVIRIWREMHSGMSVCDGYGQTETVLVCGNFGDKEIKMGSMGLPVPGVPLCVIDTDGKECEVGVEGDIAIAVSSGDDDNAFFGIYDGYLGEDGRLDQRLKISADGKTSWYRTGDRATRDKDGYFWFVGRSDDVINSSGYRIGPFEVESTLKQHPAVVESAVVASPDPERGEVVKAFVVLTQQYAKTSASNDDGSSKLIKEIQDFCKKHAAPYKYPRKIQFVSSDFLPKTISGKIKRNELKKMEWRDKGAKL